VSEQDTAELMEEFKALSQMARSGENLTPEQTARRKELRGYLKEVLLGQATSASAPPSAASPATQTTTEQSLPPPPAESSLPSPPGSSAPPPPPRPAREFKPQWAPDNFKAEASDIQEAQEKADRDLAAQNKDPRPTSPQEAGRLYLEKKAKTIYTAPVENYHLSAYYADHLQAGYSFVNMEETVALEPIDSRTEMPEGQNAANVADDLPYILRVPNNLAFLDDYPIIYELGLLPTPDQDAEPDGDDPNMWIPAKRRVILHMLNGQTRRGTIDALKRGDTQFKFHIQGTNKRGTVQIAKVKAIFVQASPNNTPEAPKGEVITVTFNDRRTIQGVSNDYHPEAQIFTLVPQAANNQFDRVIVNGKSVIDVR
tara:strand:+ start:225 stop:1334 length:1110 start_codon:yes stop_codon:yes gene_type:complete